MHTQEELLQALEGLFEHCAMVHKHWGESSNAKEAHAAIKFAQDAIRKAYKSEMIAPEQPIER